MEQRYLVVVADDYGIGPETSRGILELAGRGVVTGTVLLVNSPHAADAVRAWRRSGLPLEVGWHPNLVMDPPAAPPGRVRSLLGDNGCLLPLGRWRIVASLLCYAFFVVALAAPFVLLLLGSFMKVFGFFRSANPFTLGQWQAVYLCEFDGPRERTLNVQLLADVPLTGRRAAGSA